MNNPKDSDLIRQLAKWVSVVDQVVNESLRRPRFAWSVGEWEDIHQVGMIALIKAIRSPRFVDAKRVGAYLSMCVRSAVAQAAAESSLIRLPRRKAGQLAAADRGGGVGGPETADARRAMHLRLMDNMDRMPRRDPDATDDKTSAKISQDVAMAIELLPATIRRVLGHLYGVAGYSKIGVREIALRYGIARETVWKRSCQGRKLLRQILGGCGYGGESDGDSKSDG